MKHFFSKYYQPSQSRGKKSFAIFRHIWSETHVYRELKWYTKAVGDRSGHGRTRMRHIPFKFNSLSLKNNESYCLKLNSRTSF